MSFHRTVPGGYGMRVEFFFIPLALEATLPQGLVSRRLRKNCQHKPTLPLLVCLVCEILDLFVEGWREGGRGGEGAYSINI